MDTWEGDVVTARRARVPLVVAAALVVATVVLAWRGHDQLSTVPSFVPVWLVLVVVFDLMTLTLLTQQYRAGGNPRMLVLGWAYAWSSGLTVTVVATLGGTLTSGGLVGPDGDHAIWVAVARLVGVPLLIVVALVPWSDRFDSWLRDPEGRTARLLRTSATVAGAAVLLALFVILEPFPLPKISQTLNGALVLTTGANQALVAFTAAMLAVGLAGIGVRRRVQGLEAWALVALTASTGCAVLTLVSAAPYDVAWFGARGLGVTATFVLLIGLLQDASHLQVKVRSYARQLEQQNRELTEAQGLRDHLVAVVSHDMRNPLAGIAGYLEVLRDEPDLTGADINRIHTRARLLTRRLTLMTEDLLASAAAQDVTVIPRPVVLREELDECVGGFPDLDLIVRCPLDLQVEADSLRLQQVLSNLVGNAQKYGAEPVCVTAVRSADSARIAVSDAGPGVPADFVPRLFERYSRADPDATRGSGLGLALSRRLVQRHGGSLDYDPVANEFVMLLPALPPQPSIAAFTLAMDAQVVAASSPAGAPSLDDPTLSDPDLDAPRV